jgi:AcrR family transcriptional regulator
MSPRRVAFDRPAILAAAIDVVRRQGLAGLSARSVAARLRSSVAPVYSAFRSMSGLQRAVLEGIRRLMDDRTRLTYTDVPFLNMGVGIVTFARDEPRLFSALFHTQHRFRGILDSFHGSVLARMKADPMLSLLPDLRLDRLLDSIWLYTLGLGTALVFGYDAGRRDQDLIRLLRDMGNVLMLAEATGVADAESPEVETAWRRVFEERGLSPVKWKRAEVLRSSRPPAAATPEPKRPGRPSEPKEKS